METNLIRILAVDDEPAVRAMYEQIADDAGYALNAVGTYEDALRELEANTYHVAIIDINLTAQGDDLGLTLLEHIQGTRLRDVVGKIVVSGSSNKEHVRRALRDYQVVDFLFKSDYQNLNDESFEMALLGAIQKATSDIDLDVQLNFPATINPEMLVRNLRIEGKSLKREADLQNVTQELNVLLRKVYPGAKSLQIVPTAGGHSGTGVALIRPSLRDGIAQTAILKYGERALIEQEQKNYEEFVKNRLPSHRFPSITYTAYTPTLGGIIYPYLSSEAGRLPDFGEYYHGHSLADIKSVLEKLFSDVCSNWYANRSGSLRIDLARYYLTDTETNPDSLQKSLEDTFPEYQNQTNIILGGIRLNNPVYFELDREISKDVYFCTTHGDLNTNNILIDAHDEPWLIDFSSTGEGHSLRDIITLEADIKFRLLRPEEATIEERLELEKSLLSSRDARNNQYLQTVSSNTSIQKCFEVLKILRTYASQAIFPRYDMMEYSLGLLYITLRTLRFYSLPRINREHALGSASLMATHLGLDH